MIECCRWVERVLKSWHWTYKIAKYRSPLKYTVANQQYYVQYVTGIVGYPLDRLKYLDEARFDAKALQRKKGVSPAGQAVVGVRQQNGVCLLRCDTVVATAACPFQHLLCPASDSLWTVLLCLMCRSVRVLLADASHDAGFPKWDCGVQPSPRIQRPLGSLPHRHGVHRSRPPSRGRHSGERIAVAGVRCVR